MKAGSQSLLATGNRTIGHTLHGVEAGGQSLLASGHHGINHAVDAMAALHVPSPTLPHLPTPGLPAPPTLSSGVAAVRNLVPSVPSFMRGRLSHKAGAVGAHDTPGHPTGDTAEHGHAAGQGAASSDGGGAATDHEVAGGLGD